MDIESFKTVADFAGGLTVTGFLAVALYLFFSGKLHSNGSVEAMKTAYERIITLKDLALQKKDEELTQKDEIIQKKDDALEITNKTLSDLSVKMLDALPEAARIHRDGGGQ